MSIILLIQRQTFSFQKNAEFDMDTINSDKISQKAHNSKPHRNGSIAKNPIPARESKVTLESNDPSQKSEMVKYCSTLSV